MAKTKNSENFPASTVVDPDTGSPMDPWQYHGRPFTIGYTEVPAGNTIDWIKSGPFWVSPRTLCLNINWHDLNRLGFISGRPVMIGDQHYLCRSASCPGFSGQTSMTRRLGIGARAISGAGTTPQSSRMTPRISAQRLALSSWENPQR